MEILLREDIAGLFVPLTGAMNRVDSFASNPHHRQPAKDFSWCQYRSECMAWLPGITVEPADQQHTV